MRLKAVHLAPTGVPTVLKESFRVFLSCIFETNLLTLVAVGIPVRVHFAGLRHIMPACTNVSSRGAHFFFFFFLTFAVFKAIAIACLRGRPAASSVLMFVPIARRDLPLSSGMFSPISNAFHGSPRSV